MEIIYHIEGLRMNAWRVSFTRRMTSFFGIESRVKIRMRGVSGKIGRWSVPPSDRAGAASTITTSSTTCTDRNFRPMSRTERGPKAKPLSTKTTLKGVLTRRDAEKSKTPFDVPKTNMSIVRVPLDIAVAPLSVLRRRFGEDDLLDFNASSNLEDEPMKVPSASSQDRRNLRKCQMIRSVRRATDDGRSL